MEESVIKKGGEYMKNQNMLIGIVAAIIIVGGGALIYKSNSDAKLKAETEKAAMMKKEEDSKAMMKKENVAAVEMKDGKMMTVSETGETAMMDTDVTMKDGTKVTTKGEVMKADGTSMMMKDGEKIMNEDAMMQK